MTLRAAPPLIAHPRSAADIAGQLQRLLADALGVPAGEDTLRTALIQVAARDGEILTACVNAAPELHLRAFTEFFAGAVRPAAAARVHLAFKAAPGAAPVVVPMHTRVAAQAMAGDTVPVVFETCDDLELVRAEFALACFVDAGHLQASDRASILSASGQAPGAAEPIAWPVVRAWHIAQRAAFGVPGLREVRLQVRVVAPRARAPALPLEWGMTTPTGFAPLVLLGDTSAQLTRDGEVVLQAPVEWPPAVVEGIESRWLTVRPRAPATPGPEADADATFPPQVPRVREVALQVSASTPPLAVELACHGEAALDTSKDFFPLGERPRFGDVLHLLSPAFGQPGARLEIRVQMTNPHGAPAPPAAPIEPVSRDGRPVLAWEIATTGGYRSLAATDATRSFTADGTVMFTVPPDVASITVAGKHGPWVRARLVSGDYGRVAPPDNPQLWLPRAPAIRKLAVQSTLERGSLAAERFVRQGALTSAVLDAVAARPFDIFIAPDLDGPALYLGLAVAMPPVAATLAGGRELALVVRPRPPVPPIALVDADPVAGPRWQLRTAAGWQDAVVRDTSAGCARAGLVRLRLPGDAVPWPGAVLDPAGRLAWLRLAWPSAVDATRRLPAGLALNGVLAVQAQRLRDELLGSSNGRAGQAFKALRTPIIGDVELQVRESGADWTTWEAVADLSSSLPDERHFTLDRTTGDVRFGDGRHGRIPPAGAGNVRLHAYAVGGGRQGNRPALAITQLRSAVPAVAAVVNPEPAVGGVDVEGEAEIRAHASAWLRHRDRAVCADDYADLARKATPEVARAWCVAGRDLAVAEAGGSVRPPEPGIVSVVIVPQATVPRPQPSLELLAQVRDYLDARRAVGGRLVMVGPTYADASVTLDICVRHDWSPHAVAAECVARITRFLHPLEGGVAQRGWAIGKRPHRSDLFALAGAIDGVDGVRALHLQVDAPAGAHWIAAAGAVDVRVSE